MKTRLFLRYLYRNLRNLLRYLLFEQSARITENLSSEINFIHYVGIALGRLLFCQANSIHILIKVLKCFVALLKEPFSSLRCPEHFGWSHFCCSTSCARGRSRPSPYSWSIRKCRCHSWHSGKIASPFDININFFLLAGKLLPLLRTLNLLNTLRNN